MVPAFRETGLSQASKACLKTVLAPVLISAGARTVLHLNPEIGSGFVIGSGFSELLFAREVAIAVEDRHVGVGHDELGRGAAVVFQ